MNYLEGFSGYCGFGLALRNLDIQVDNHWFSEIDKYAIANTRYNFPNAIYAGSIQSVYDTIGNNELDLFTFGFPCQDLSIAGKRKGLAGERSGLFFESIKIIEHYKPKVFVFENVEGLLSSNEGKDFETILNTIADLGLYDCEWQLINTRWFLPQNRERIFFVGHLRGSGSRKIFPIGEGDHGIIKGATNTPVIRTFTAGGNSGGKHSGMSLIRWQNKNDGIVESEFSPALRASGGTDIRKMPKIKYSFDFVKAVLTPNREQKRQNGRRFKENGEPMFTLTGQDQHGVMIDSNIRRLTPIECERLQGLPDNWTKYGIINGKVVEISDTQRYNLCGNGVSTPPVMEIFKRLYL